MGKDTNIEWAHHTFNPWEGCTKVGPGCDHCYAETRNNRFNGGNWGVGAPRRKTSESNWKNPVRWNKEASEKGARYRVFCASLADVFDNEVRTSWLVELFQLIKDTPNLDWLMLTKRIGNVPARIQAAIDAIAHLKHLPDTPQASLHEWLTDWLHHEVPPANIWLGATIVNQQEADRDIQKLMSVPAAIRFLSMEPLLGPVSLRWLSAWPENGQYVAQKPDNQNTDHLDGLRRIDWVIVGGESGPDARPMHPNWVFALRDQCQAAGVPFLFKQWGEWVPRSACYHTFEDGKSCSDMDPGNAQYPCIRLTEEGTDGHRLENSTGGDEAYMQRVGKKMAGRLLQGELHTGYPEIIKEEAA